ncbi:hypothetical protein F4680DRAFT_445914 [Xylaria scruposa]|nr:hypothetical protein F4680DRAFT_445914 [Xylaria scruposa]
MYSIQAPDENPAWRYIIFNSVLNVLTIIVVSFRLYSRRLTRAGFGWDDGLILAATLLVNGMLILAGFLIYLGFGLPLNKVAHDDRKRVTELDRLFRLLFLLCLCSVKLSALFFYVRVFGVRTLSSNRLPNPRSGGNTNLGVDTFLHWIRSFSCPFCRFAQGVSLRSTYIFFMYVVIAWSIANVIQEVAACPPNGPMCVEQRRTDLGICVFNAVSDVLIFLLPLWPIWKLQMGRSSKIGLSFLFLLGTVTIIVAFLRFVAIANTDYGGDYNATGMKAVNYAILEPNLAILCMSLPMAKPLLLKAIPYCRSKFQGRNGGSFPDWWTKNPFAGRFTHRWTGELLRVFSKPKEASASSGNSNIAKNHQSPLPNGTISNSQLPAIPLPLRLRSDGRRRSRAGAQYGNGDETLVSGAGGLWRADSHGSLEDIVELISVYQAARSEANSLRSEDWPLSSQIGVAITTNQRLSPVVL